MDCYKILQLLLELEEDAASSINEKQLQEILDTVFLELPQLKAKIEEERNSIIDSKHVGWKFLHLLLYTIKIINNAELSDQNFMLTVDQLCTIKKTVELIASAGILPSLSPQINIHATTTTSKKYNSNQNDHGILEKYKILKYTIDGLLECFNKTVLRPVLMPQMGCMIAALLQLAHAPLKEPAVHNSPHKVEDFNMSVELYVQLKQDQTQYRKKLYEFINDCHQPMLIKELMMILGVKKNPKWIVTVIKDYLTDRIMQSDGITSLAVAICDNISDLGNCWGKLEITAQLVATSHGSSIEKYFSSVCSQIFQMLSSKDKQKIIIANCCMKALYEKNPEIFTEKLINVILDPFLSKYSVKKNPSSLVKTEEEVSQSIENLYKLYVSAFQYLPGAEFKCLPAKFLISVALPIFQLHIKSYKSIYEHRDKVRQLLLKILADDSNRQSIFSAFLSYEESNDHDFGEKLNFRFGSQAQFEVISEPLSVEYDEIADCLFDLVEKNKCLSFDLFICLLNILPKLDKVTVKADEGKLLETSADTVDRIEKQLSAVKLLILLSNSTLVQKAQLENPQPILNFITFYFSKIISKKNISEEISEPAIQEQDSAILYTCLMFIKVIITDNNVKKSWKIFEDFIISIKQKYDIKKFSSPIVNIVNEIETIVKKKGKSFSKSSYDLSVDNQNLNEFEKALADLSDPLLPVRAHGIITFTKLIERRHPEVELKKDFLLCVFQENLNDDDSFIYLAAINGLCAMSSMYPDEVIEVLVQEFVGLTQGSRSKEVPPETRSKLGEILVKTTRALGEMTPKYKNLLVNGFLSGTRDSDPLVRASSLSCLGEFCKIMGFRLGNLITEILYCIGCIIKTDKDDGCRRAGVLVATLLLQGLGKDALTSLGENLVELYRSLKYLRDNDKDPTLQLHAQLALKEFDDIVQKFLFEKPKLEKSIFLLSNNM